MVSALCRHCQWGMGLMAGGLMILAACTAQPSPPPLTIPATLATSLATLETVSSIVVPTLSAPQFVLGALDHDLGPSDAYLSIVYYLDFQCELCVDVVRSLIAIQQRYPTNVRLIYRPFPQPTSDKAALAAQAVEAASDQGKFWPMHDLLLAQQAAWRSLSLEDFRRKVIELALQAGVTDMTVFNHTLDTQRYKPLLDIAIQEAQKQGIQGVSALLFNGIRYQGRVDEYALDSYTRLRLLEQRWYPSAPLLQIDLNKRYYATLKTSKGDIYLELFPKAAPSAVNNFVFLARQGWYNNITWHLVKHNFAAQTGDPSGTGYGIAGYNIVDEFDNGLKFDKAGVVAMANAIQNDQPHSASSQFFITYQALQPANFYDRHYTIFGQVLQGMDVLKQLTERNPFDEANPNPPPGDVLISVTIDERDGTAPTP